MHRVLIGLASMVVALPASAQVNVEDVAQCNNGAPDAQVGACTALIESGRLKSSDLATAYYNRGNRYRDMGLFDQAIADYNRAIEFNLHYAAAYDNRGIAYDYKGLHDRAVADYTRAIELKPNLANAYNNRAWSYQLRGQDAQGLPDAQKAVALSPTDPINIETRGQIYEKLNRRDEAIADYRAALNIRPGMKDALDGLNRLGVAP